MTVFEDLRSLQKTVRDLAEQVEQNRSAIARHEEQLNGERGLSAAMRELASELKSLRKAAYWVAGLIVAASISFAFSVLALFT